MDPLEAALSSSFTTPNIPTTSPKPASSAGQEAPKASAGGRGHLPSRSVELEAERLAAMDDTWKGVYDKRLSAWKAENAARREQSERTRSEWEHREDSTFSFANPSGSATSSVVDAKDLVGGEGEGGKDVQAPNAPPPSSATTTTTTTTTKPANHPSTASGSGEDNSQGWENVPSDSLASSYPSINFAPLDGSQPGASGSANPSRSRGPFGAPSPSSPHYARRGQGGSGGDGGGRGQSLGAFTLPPVAPPSVTLAIFDSTLSTRTRLFAVASSLAINLLLPFINGIMLGFGEIAAKSLFGWSGWREVAGSLGLRAAGSRREGGKVPAGIENGVGVQNKTPTILTMP